MKQRISEGTLRERLNAVAAVENAFPGVQADEEFRFVCDLLADVRDAREHICALEQWVADLQSGMYVNCVYCGHRYGPNPETPVAMADVLKAHIEKCPEHPLSQARAEIERLRAELRGAPRG